MTMTIYVPKVGDKNGCWAAKDAKPFSAPAIPGAPYLLKLSNKLARDAQPRGRNSIRFDAGAKPFKDAPFVPGSFRSNPNIVKSLQLKVLISVPPYLDLHATTATRLMTISRIIVRP
jgi:hypothetical protein